MRACSAVVTAAAAAVLLSDDPKVVEYELLKKGTWTTDVYDTFRPTARHESGNNEVSLYSYMDALEGAYKNYVEHAGEHALEGVAEPVFKVGEDAHAIHTSWSSS